MHHEPDSQATLTDVDHPDPAPNPAGTARVRRRRAFALAALAITTTLGAAGAAVYAAERGDAPSAASTAAEAGTAADSGCLESGWSSGPMPGDATAAGSDNCLLPLRPGDGCEAEGEAFVCTLTDRDGISHHVTVRDGTVIRDCAELDGGSACAINDPFDSSAGGATRWEPDADTGDFGADVPGSPSTTVPGTAP